MITFKKYGYTLHDLITLNKAINKSFETMECTEKGCNQCIYKRPCSDLCTMRDYVEQLIHEKTKPN